MVVIFAAMIHWNLKNTGIALLIVVGQMLLFSCANIIPPGGGPRDTIAPRLIMANPKDSSKNVISQNITLTFDEYV
ncbi:MAG TPA: Ig-like domain-containing protein, partial [Sediminibacterium sp.]|nr:Ig-like domain-containing protein [Sediminibacterium sp.]